MRLFNERNSWRHMLQLIKEKGTPEEKTLYQEIADKYENKANPVVTKIAWMILQNIYLREGNEKKSAAIENGIAALCQLTSK